MNLTIDLLALGTDSSNFIEIGTCRISRIMETGITDLYEVHMGHAKLVFVLGKSPMAKFRVIHESDTRGVLEIVGHCTTFSIDCTLSDVYKFELFMMVAVQRVSETFLHEVLKELSQTIEHAPQQMIENNQKPKAA